MSDSFGLLLVKFYKFKISLKNTLLLSTNNLTNFKYNYTNYCEMYSHEFKNALNRIQRYLMNGHCLMNIALMNGNLLQDRDQSMGHHFYYANILNNFIWLIVSDFHKGNWLLTTNMSNVKNVHIRLNNIRSFKLIILFKSKYIHYLINFLFIKIYHLNITNNI